MKYILPVITLSFLSVKMQAQGCSDAGICTIHSFKNNTESSEQKDAWKNDLTIGFAFGKGERNTSDYTPYVEYTRSISSRTAVTGKFSYAAVTGELANTSGPGDLFLSVNHSIDSKRKWQKSFTVGLKLPLDNADIEKNGIHLPMPYQTSLGTTDLVLGINFIRHSFGITLGVQQPLKPINSNRFLPEEYPALPLAGKYLPSNLFSRKGDVLLRFSWNYDLDKKFSIRPSLLSIYHETNDTYVDIHNVRKVIPKSEGLTVNGNVFVDYKINKASGLELSLGTPFIIRTNRPDGLTRSFVSSLEYRIAF